MGMTHLKGISSVKIMKISLCWWKFIIISDQTEMWSHLYDKKLMDVVALVGFLVPKLSHHNSCPQQKHDLIRSQSFIEFTFILLINLRTH